MQVLQNRYTTEIGEQAGVPVINIVPQGYSPLGGKILLKQVKETLGV